MISFDKYLARNRASSPLFNKASMLQYSCGLKARTSFSRSQISFTVIDWTRPAERPLLTFFHKSGESLYPTSRSRILRVCCASTLFMSIFLGCFMAFVTASFVISWNSILLIFLSDLIRYFKCHAIASPSRSGSGAR